MCHGPLRFCNDLHVLKVDPYHVEQPLKQFWSCLNDWNLFSFVGLWLLKNVIYDLGKSASPEAFYSPLFAVGHYFFDRVYIAEWPPVWERAVLSVSCAFRKLLSIYVFSYFPFGFEGRMWDLIVSFPDHCLSFYFIWKRKIKTSIFQWR